MSHADPFELTPIDQRQPVRSVGKPRSYMKPSIQRVELAIDETLSTGCKLGSDSGCVGPPVTAFEGGS